MTTVGNWLKGKRKERTEEECDLEIEKNQRVENEKKSGERTRERIVGEMKGKDLWEK